MKTSTRFAISSTFVALVLAACSAGTTPALPQESTATVAPPTATTAPATPTPATEPTVADNAGETLDSSALGAALTKFASASAYRAEMEMKGKGAIGVSTDDSNGEETSLFTLNGDFKGADGHYTLKGFLSSLLGVEPTTGVEAMIVGGKGYVHGPINLLGATEDKWYVLEGAQSQAINPPFDVSSYLGALSNSDVQLNNFKSAGNETVDGQNCQIFSGDKTEAAKALTALNAGMMPSAEDLANIDNATAKFSLCDDGYIHSIQLALDTSAKDNADTKASFSVNIHMYDFNASISIAAPEDASPLNTADLLNVTETPAP